MNLHTRQPHNIGDNSDVLILLRDFLIPFCIGIIILFRCLSWAIYMAVLYALIESALFTLQEPPF